MAKYELPKELEDKIKERAAQYGLKKEDCVVLAVSDWLAHLDRGGRPATVSELENPTLVS